MYLSIFVRRQFKILLLVRYILYILRNIYNFHPGTHQTRMAKSYIQEHLTTSVLSEDESEFIVESCPIQADLVRMRFNPRHSNRKIHIATVQFDEENVNPIRGCHCTCIPAARDLGCCVHAAAVLWHMGVQRAKINPTMHPLSAAKLLQACNDTIQYSQSDNDI